MENGAEGPSTAVKYEDTVVEPKEGQLMNLQSCFPSNDNEFSMASPLTGSSGSVDEEIHSEDTFSSKSEFENTIPEQHLAENVFSGEFTSPSAGFPQVDNTCDWPADWSLPSPERRQRNEGLAAYHEHSGAKPKKRELHVMNLQSCKPGNDNEFSMASPFTGFSGSVDEEIHSEALADAVSSKSEFEDTVPEQHLAENVFAGEFTSPSAEFPQVDNTCDGPDWSLPPPERRQRNNGGLTAYHEHSGAKPKKRELHVKNRQSCKPDAVSTKLEIFKNTIPEQHLVENVSAEEFTSPSAGFPPVDNTCDGPDWNLPPPERRQRNNEGLAACHDHSGAKPKKRELHVKNLQSCSPGNDNEFSMASPFTGFSGCVDEEIHSEAVAGAVSAKSEFKNNIPEQHLAENVSAGEFTSPSAGFPRVDNTCDWPDWSLPPPERRQRNNEGLAAYHDHSGANFKKGHLHVMNKQSCSPGNDNAFSMASPFTGFSGSVEEIRSEDGTDVSAPECRSGSASETLSRENATPHKEITCTCMKQSEQESSITPASQEEEKDGRVSINAGNLLVTGPPLLISSVDVVACSSSSENLSSQQRGTPAEHDDSVGDVGLLEELTKKIERLHLKDTILMQENQMLYRNAAYLIQKERLRDDELRAMCMEIRSLRQQLEAARTVNVEQRIRINDLEEQIVEVIYNS